MPLPWGHQPRGDQRRGKRGVDVTTGRECVWSGLGLRALPPNRAGRHGLVVRCARRPRTLPAAAVGQLAPNLLGQQFEFLGDGGRQIRAT